MNVLFVGVLDVPYSTNIPMKRAFERRGHSVDVFNYRSVTAEQSSHSSDIGRRTADFLGRMARWFDRNGMSNGIFYRVLGRGVMNRRLIEQVRNNGYDLVFFAKADSVHYETVREISNLSDTWYYFMDPDVVARRMQAGKYAAAATWCSASYSSVAKQFSQKGGDSFFVPQGVDSELFSPGDRTKSIDVVFVGRANSRRRRFVRRLEDNGIDVVCHGGGWENESIYRTDLVELYQRSKVILNLQGFPPEKQGSGFSIRVFQAMGTGSFLLSEHCPDLENVFERGEHLDWFNEPEECVEKVRYYLDNPAERETIAETGLEYVHRNYSWVAIIDRILAIVNDERTDEVPHPTLDEL
jgi:glycosyltransferase involved in cell wall biosynthesis